MANMRKVFLGILKTYGHDVFLQRRDGDTSGPHPQPRFKNVLEKHTCRRMFPSASLDVAAEERPEGIVTTVDMIFYFMHTVAPKEGDRIYEPDSRYPGGRAIYRIDYANSVRGKRGEITYWVAGATKDTDNQ